MPGEFVKQNREIFPKFTFESASRGFKRQNPVFPCDDPPGINSTSPP
jgi:hypothetical protein